MKQKLDVVIGNYRCFHKTIPIKLSLEPGKTIALLGRNNAGKSTLMRFFYELKYPLFNYRSGQSRPINDATTIFNPTDPLLNGNGTRYGLHDLLDIYPNRDSANTVNFSISSLNFTCEFEITREHSGSHQLTKKITTHKQADTNEQAETAEIVKLIKDAIYFGAHRNLVNEVAGGGTYFDLSVGSVFTNEWDYLKNGNDTQNASSALSAERLIADLLEWPSLSINASSDKKQIFLTKNGVERYAISELGAGISELVICIVTAAIKKPSWIFIDEPESHLHPSLQIKFIEALTLLASHGLVFTTHSIGLARTCADTILVVQQDKQNRSSLRPFESINNFSQLLGELAFSQFHELGYNKLLLCEGVTEVKTLRQILRHWKLDASVMIIPLGGDALINPQRHDELNEFNRFGVEVFVIVDSERTSAENSNLPRSKFVALCNKLFGANHAMETELRATENYFKSDAISRAMRSKKYTPLQPFQNSNDTELFWGKNENWKIAAEMTKDDWLETDIGKFIQKMAS